LKVLEKSLNLNVPYFEISAYYLLIAVPPDVIFQGQNGPNSISAGALPQTLLGAHSTPPDPIAGCKGSYF